MLVCRSTQTRRAATPRTSSVAVWCTWRRSYLSRVAADFTPWGRLDHVQRDASLINGWRQSLTIRTRTAWLRHETRKESAMKRQTRRDFLATAGGVVAAAATGVAYQSRKKLYAYVGSTTQGQFGAGGGGGIPVFSVDANDGSLSAISKTSPEMDGLNADGMCISRDGRFLYAVDERRNLDGKAGAGGGIAAFAINQSNGELRHLNTQPSMGVNPAYVDI